MPGPPRSRSGRHPGRRRRARRRCRSRPRGSRSRRTARPGRPGPSARSRRRGRSRCRRRSRRPSSLSTTPSSAGSHGDQVARCTRAEEPLAALVHVGVVVVPAEPVTVGGRREDPVGVADGAVARSGRSRAGTPGCTRRSARRRARAEGVGAVGGVVGDEGTGGLGVEPLAGVGLGGVGRCGEAAAVIGPLSASAR